MVRSPKIMPVNSISQMMTPAHMQASVRAPIAQSIIQKVTAKPARDENTIPDLKPKNGVDHYVLPLQRLLFTYCSHCGDSKDQREFITKHVVEVAKANPSVEVVVEARWDKRPSIYAHYLNGRQKVVSVPNIPVKEIKSIVEDLRGYSGAKPKPFHQGVSSDTPAIRPSWSPFHNPPVGKDDPLIHARFVESD